MSERKKKIQIEHKMVVDNVLKSLNESLHTMQFAKTIALENLRHVQEQIESTQKYMIDIYCRGIDALKDGPKPKDPAHE